ncbi:hypothetical protein [Alkalibacillus aidingensis]|uniref:hypothetical protein n=1 Tax=Alkalibacillus aidingensis TaxID=2747607 RepID=UPI00166168A5|nr:hypothetical protein [Alkalibacillus aidingensis]
MKWIIPWIMILAILVGCQSGSAGTETEDAVDEIDEMNEALVDFQGGNPDNTDEYLGAWSTYTGEDEAYQLLQIKEEDGEFLFNFDAIDAHGRLSNSYFGEMDEPVQGFGEFIYKADQFGTSGQFEIEFQEDGLLVFHEINLENRDDTRVEEFFFGRKLERQS